MEVHRHDCFGRLRQVTCKDPGNPASSHQYQVDNLGSFFSNIMQDVFSAALPAIPTGYKSVYCNHRATSVLARHGYAQAPQLAYLAQLQLLAGRVPTPERSCRIYWRKWHDPNWGAQKLSRAYHHLHYPDRSFVAPIARGVLGPCVQLLT